MSAVDVAQEEALARRFKALSDEKRIRILQLLSGGERCVCELMPALGLQQSLLSFHLRALKDAGLVSDRRAGRWVHYSLVPEALEELGHFATVLALEAESISASCHSESKPRCDV